MSRRGTFFVLFLLIGFLLLASDTCLATQEAQSRPTYSIGDIPPQTAWHNRSLIFIVKAAAPDAAVTYSVSASPQPKGLLTIDPATGLFTYTPSSDDKFEFKVSFTTTSQGSAVRESQTVVFTPMPHLPSENDIVEQKRRVPDAASSDYITVAKQLNKGEELFNTIKQQTRSITITGKTVVFDANNDANKLYQRFNNNPDIKELSIYAETLIIKSPLKLPQTTVNIYARELRFEDKDGAAAKAIIDTAPTSLQTAPNQFQNGAPGLAGGDVSLRIDKFFSSPSAIKRIIAKGGSGQEAGAGQRGTNGTSMPSRTDILIMANGSPLRAQYDPPRQPVVYVEGGRGQTEWGTKAFPQNCEDAKPAGKPGDGGKGGNVRSTLPELEPLVDRTGGSAGKKGEYQEGGAAGSPSLAVWVRQVGRPPTMPEHFPPYFNVFMADSRTRGACQGAPAPDADVLVGASGKFEIIGNKDTSWVHPFTVRAVLAHVKDAYLNGNIDYARGVLEDYKQVLSSKNLAPDDLQLEQSRGEIDSLLHRIANNLDYFGNPAGWVPLLSLEANMRAFNNEVDAAIPILYLSYWIQKRADENRKDVQALQDAMSRLDQEVEQAITEYNDAQRLIPDLQFNASEIANKIQVVQGRIKDVEESLNRRAQENIEERHKVPFWKKAARVLSVACKVIPVYQPVLGSIGAGLDIISQFDATRPLESIEQVRDLSKAFTKEKFSEASDQLKAEVAKLNRRNSANAKEYAKNLLEAGKKLAPAVSAITEAMKGTQAPRSEIEAEIQKIKAEDPEFNALIQEVSELNSQKELFAQSLAQTTQTINSLSEKMTMNLLAIAEMNRNLDNQIAQLDEGTLIYVKEMERRAKERLLKYQYYMAKSYEYRMLKPYPGDFRLNDVVNRLTQMLGANYTLSQQDFAPIKSVYTASVREIIDKGLSELQQKPPERSLPFRFELTANELKELNENGEVSIDLVDKIRSMPGEENRRIADLGVIANGMNVQVVGEAPGFARMRVVFQHQGHSVLFSEGRSYAFRYGSKGYEKPFTWGVSYDAIDKTTDPESLSLAGLSLLRSFLGLENDNKLLPFIRPAADSVITIKRYKDPADFNMQISRLRLYVTVDFFRNDSDQVMLNVAIADGMTPYFTLNRTDITGRGDGRGSFRRAFRQGETVVITAQPTYGSFKFRRWVNETGASLGVSPTIQITMTGSRSVRAEYAK